MLFEAARVEKTLELFSYQTSLFLIPHQRIGRKDSGVVGNVGSGFRINIFFIYNILFSSKYLIIITYKMYNNQQKK